MVLYDNVQVNGTRAYPNSPYFGPLTPTDIDNALYGLWQANVRIHPDFKTESLGDTRSNWRRIHDRQIISAVCVVYEHPENDGLYNITYHNFWAVVPLPKHLFHGKNDAHVAKGSDPDLQPNPWEKA